MIFRSRFLIGLVWRLALLLLAAFAFVAALQRPDLGAARVVAGLLVIGAAAMLWRHVQRTNMELARFIDAVKFGDFSQGFSHRADGSGFAELGGAVGRPRLVPLLSDGVPQTMLVSAAVVHRLGGLVRVVAVQPIQGELNAIEIAAQSDLIRVLTHEIMNSMTPVTSLAHSAAGLMRGVDAGDNADVADARQAVETLARRADGVMHFVESYRQISRASARRRCARGWSPASSNS